MPPWAMVNDRNTPAAYSGMSMCVSPENASTKTMANAEANRMPCVYTSRDPLSAKRFGRNPSRESRDMSCGRPL